MGENSKIEWTDHTFNVAWGCEKVSPACDHCYAETWAKRYGMGWGKDAPRRVMSENHWRAPEKWNTAAQKAGKVARVFCSSMADVFEDHLTLAAQRGRLWPIIDRTPFLQWLLLTKRPENVRAMVPPPWLKKWPTNVIFGTTVENQEWAERRLPHLIALGARCFVSYEPALGPIDLTFGVPNPQPIAFAGETMPAIAGIDWLIAGGESGAGARPMMLSWVRSIRDQCKAAGVSFFLKQKIEDGRKISLPMLDGRQWAEMPR